MPRKLATWMVSELLPAAELPGTSAVVIDILRASSTITTALTNGAEEVIPCLTIEQAQAQRSVQVGRKTILGGERGGMLIPGFDLGNSPRDYSPERMRQHSVIFTTTNGTKALQRCRGAEDVLIGCFLNVSAVMNRLLTRSRDVHLVCAGTNNSVTLEDCLFAGVLAQKLLSVEQNWELDDATRLCLTLAEKWGDSTEAVQAGLLQSQGGRNLTRLQLQADIAYCAQIDLLSLVPVWDQETDRIQPCQRNDA